MNLYPQMTSRKHAINSVSWAKEHNENLNINKLHNGNKHYENLQYLSGGYYKIDLANRKLELVGLNTALYLESNMVNIFLL